MATWQIEEPESTLAPTAVPSQNPISLHYVRTTVQRRMRALVIAALLGLLLGVTMALVIPGSRTGTVTLYLAHDTSVDPNTAMATDVSLLRTRAVAQGVIDDLALDATPEGLQSLISLTPATSAILEIDIAGPDGTAAQKRAEVLADKFLTFRADQLRSQSDAVISGEEARVNKLSAEMDLVSTEYDALVGSAAGSQDEASTLLTRRAQLADQISSLQQDMDQRRLTTSAVITASHVVDPASVVPSSDKRRLVLAGMSGLIGGTAIGLAWVLVTALVSQRLRRRDEVARSLGVPVRFSVRRSRPFPWLQSRMTPALPILASAIGSELGGGDDRSRQRIAFVSVGALPEAGAVAHELGTQTAATGQAVCLVALTDQVLPADRGAAEGLTVVREEPGAQAVIALVKPEDRRRAAPAPRGAWETADCVLAVDEVDLGLGVSHLTEWADRAVLVIAAGRATSEVLETVGRLFRVARLPVAFAVLVGADAADVSCGVLESSTSRATP